MIVVSDLMTFICLDKSYDSFGKLSPNFPKYCGNK